MINNQYGTIGPNTFNMTSTQNIKGGETQSKFTKI